MTEEGVQEKGKEREGDVFKGLGRVGKRRGVNLEGQLLSVQGIQW